MLTIARTLMGNPELLLLDEPSEGLSPLVVKELEEQVRRLKEEGMTILLSEQNSAFTLRLSDRGYILEKGQVKWEGRVEDASGEAGNPETLSGPLVRKYSCNCHSEGAKRLKNPPSQLKA